VAARGFSSSRSPAWLVPQPLLFRTPVHVLLGLPHVHAPAAEPEGLEPHRLEGAVSRQDHQVGPRDLVAVLLLDRPQQPACLVQVHVVGPAVDRREPLVARGAAPSAVADPVRAGAVPGQADEEGAVVAVVRGPPVLGVRHQGVEVLLHGLQVQLGERLGVVERLAERVGLGAVLVEDPEVQLVRPPVPHGRAAEGGGLAMRPDHRALALWGHGASPSALPRSAGMIPSRSRRSRCRARRRGWGRGLLAVGKYPTRSRPQGKTARAALPQAPTPHPGSPFLKDSNIAVTAPEPPSVMELKKSYRLRRWGWGLRRSATAEQPGPPDASGAAAARALTRRSGPSRGGPCEAVQRRRGP